MRAIILMYFYWIIFSYFIMTIVIVKNSDGFPRMPTDKESLYAVAFGYLIAATFIHYGVVPI